jgi:hypothetical protein
MTIEKRGPAVRLTLVAQPDPAPADVRLRRALKCLLRSFGLRCVEVVEVSPGAGVAAQGTAGALRDGRRAWDEAGG